MTHHLSEAHKLTPEQLQQVNVLKEDTSSAGRENLQTFIFDALVASHSKVNEPIPEPQGDYPYPAIGTPMQSTERRAIRHYNSNKPDDETYERNVKNIKFNHYQFVVDLQINDMKHDDTASLKLGGTHMKSGWLDNGVGIYTGQICLGTEKKHPSTQLCVVRGPKIGDIRKKRIKIASTYFKDINKTEMWTNLGAGWKKQLEGTNVNNFNPNSAINEAQLRIDGFVKGNTTNKAPEPEVFSAVVTEIA